MLVVGCWLGETVYGWTVYGLRRRKQAKSVGCLGGASWGGGYPWAGSEPSTGVGAGLAGDGVVLDIESLARQVPTFEEGPGDIWRGSRPGDRSYGFGARERCGFADVQSVN